MKHERHHVVFGTLPASAYPARSELISRPSPPPHFPSHLETGALPCICTRLISSASLAPSVSGTGRAGTGKPVPHLIYDRDLVTK